MTLLLFGVPAFAVIIDFKINDTEYAALRTARTTHAATLASVRAVATELPGGLDIVGGPWIAGSAAVAGICPAGHIKPPGDIDVYFRTQEQLDRVLAFLDANGELMPPPPETTPSSRTPPPAADGTSAPPVLPGLVRTYAWKGVFVNVAALILHPDPVTLVSRFDFTVCQVATDGRRCVVGPRTIEDLAAKRLVVARETHPARVKKYLGKGYRLPDDVVFSDGIDMPGFWRKGFTLVQSLGLAPPPPPPEAVSVVGVPGPLCF